MQFMSQFIQFPSFLWQETATNADFTKMVSYSHLHLESPQDGYRLVSSTSRQSGGKHCLWDIGKYARSLRPTRLLTPVCVWGGWGGVEWAQTVLGEDNCHLCRNSLHHQVYYNWCCLHIIKEQTRFIQNNGTATIALLPRQHNISLSNISLESSMKSNPWEGCFLFVCLFIFLSISTLNSYHLSKCHHIVSINTNQKTD